MAGNTAERARYRAIARFYDLLELPFEVLRYRNLRRRLFEGASGEVLDAGAGTGRNLPFYPRGASVMALDHSPEMLVRARRRAERLGARVDIREADVRDTGLADGRFDVIIATFLFCVLAEEDQLPALSELARVTKPGGEIRLLDYTWSRRPLRRLVMRLWAPFVRRLYGASFGRDPAQHAEAAGLRVAEDRFVYSDMIRMLVLRPD
jgi:ubiquinone/menaquinone biosynthesis C-methylase UbiE